MKRFFSAIALMVIVMSVASCKFNDSPKTEEVTTTTKLHTNILTENVEMYPRDIDLFGDNAVNKRIQALLSDQYETMLSNFNTQSAIVTDEGLYKVTGCKAHDCVGYLTTILYDAHNDNLNVIISIGGKVKVYAEKGPIVVTRALQVK